MGKDKRMGNRIRDWKGLLASESASRKRIAFAMLLLVSGGMTFTQFGFIGVGPETGYLGYILGLLGPITLCSLLLGKGPGTLFGLLSGAILLLHSSIQPLDLYEFYFVGLLNSIVLYPLMGFLLGLLFAIALRKNPKRKLLRFFVIALFVAIVSSVLFMVNAIIDVFSTLLRESMDAANSATTTMPMEAMSAITALGGLDVQVICDTLLIFGAAALGERRVRAYYESQSYIGVRDIFRRWLLATLLVVFILVQAGSFTAITITSLDSASKRIGDEVSFLALQIDKNTSHQADIAEQPEFAELSVDMKETLFGYDPSVALVGGYDLTEGLIMAFEGDDLAYTNDTDPPGGDVEECYGGNGRAMLDSLAETGELRTIVFGATSFVDIIDQAESQSEKGASQDTVTNNEVSPQLGYMRVTKRGPYTVLMVEPASRVFVSRSSTMRWATVLALSLVGAAYVVAAWILNRVVVEPIEHTNESLGRIMQGNLNELVKETGTVEFATFSADINSTVDALKGLIDEAERRNEQDMAVAKRIQESALPRTFPPFPEIGAFDIFASMDAAKQVGGDFYDFFLVDEGTLGFLIADVSGKGIPGALFMMAAKTEIENYMSTGMPPAEAIASANRRLCQGNEAGMFVTVWAATLEWETGLLTYVNAGHNFPLLRRGQGGSWEWLRKKCGLFLGTFETAKYRQETLTLERGDELVLYTDGVNEAFNVDEEEFGNDRLEAFLADHAYMDPKMLVHRLRAEVAGWAKGAEQSDDITILALEYGAAPEASGSLTLPATVDSLAAANQLVTDELDRRLCPLSVKNKIDIALEELFVNVCRYAYADQDEPGEVTVSYLYKGDPSTITVELRDTGVPFDPVRREDPTKPSSIQETAIGGLGIFMVKRSMDEFTYERDGNENVVTLVKSW